MKITEQVLDTISQPCRDIRTEVFMDEQGFVNEFDEQDATAVHFLVHCDGEPAGTARMMKGERDGEYIVGRVSVKKKFRSEHLGSRLMLMAEREARQRGGTFISVSAQCRVQQFYRSLGYEAMGEIYLDEYCEHIHMEKRL